MMMLSEEAIEDVLAIKEEIADSEKKEECLNEIEKLIEMKQAHIWRADCGTCCGNICGLVSQIESESKILQDALDALKEDNTSKASALLEDYVTFLKKNYEIERPTY